MKKEEAKLDPIQLEKRKKAKKIWGRIGTIALGVFLLGGGIAGGFVLGKLKKPKEIVLHIDADKLSVDKKALMDKYKKTDNYLSLTPAEAANISLFLFDDLENSTSVTIGRGTAAMGVLQDMCSSKIKVGNKYFEESLSKSDFMSTTLRFYGENEQYQSYRGDIPGDFRQANWNESSKKELSKDEMKEKAGFPLSEHPSNYTITEYTILKNKNVSGTNTSFVKNEKGYLIDLEFNVNYACENYKTLMVYTSDLYSRPIFEYSHVSIQTDEKLFPLNLKIKEKYNAQISAILDSTVEAELRTYFLPQEKNQNIPSLKENVDYSEAK